MQIKINILSFYCNLASSESDIEIQSILLSLRTFNSFEPRGFKLKLFDQIRVEGMKKKVKPLSKELKMPCVFLDDLEEIEEIIKNELKPRSYTIETNDYEYTSLSELPKGMKSITELEIVTSIA